MPVCLEVRLIESPEVRGKCQATVGSLLRASLDFESFSREAKGRDRSEAREVTREGGRREEAQARTEAMIRDTMLYCIILYYTILYYIILYYTILYYIILYSTILYYFVLYVTILYYIGGDDPGGHQQEAERRRMADCASRGDFSWASLGSPRPLCSHPARECRCGSAAGQRHGAPVLLPLYPDRFFWCWRKGQRRVQ